MKIEREMTEKERKVLLNLLDQAYTTFKKWKEAGFFTLVGSGGLLFILVLIWIIVAWIASVLFDANIGLKIDNSKTVFGVLAIVSVIYPLVDSIRWARNLRSDRGKICQDIENGKVIVESYRISDIKRFQEQEHGGLIYFLQIKNKGVLVLYDHKSTEICIDGGDPLSSPFKPRENLNIVRAPETNYPISTKFSGAKLPLPEVLDLMASTDLWPDDDTWCDIPWSDLESVLTRKNGTREQLFLI